MKTTTAAVVIVFAFLSSSVAAVAENGKVNNNFAAVCRLMRHAFVLGSTFRCSGATESEAMSMLHDVGSSVVATMGNTPKAQRLVNDVIYLGLHRAYMVEPPCCDVNTRQLIAREIKAKCMEKVSTLKLHKEGNNTHEN